MIFMNLQGPSGRKSHANVSPRDFSRKQIQKTLLRDGQREIEKWSTSNNGGGKSSSSNKKIPVASATKIAEPVAVKPVKVPPPPPVKAKPAKAKAKATSPPQYKTMLQQKDWDVNTDNFPGALHLHFVEEQKDPSFRSGEQTLIRNAHWDQAEIDAHAKMVKQDAVIESCQYYDKDTGLIRIKSECGPTGRKKPNNGIVAYNSQPFVRTWCGKSIKPYSIQHFPADHCNLTEPVRLLVTDSDAPLGAMRKDLKKLPPVVVKRTGSDAKVEFVQDCDVNCRFTMDTCNDAYGKAQKGPGCLPDVSDWTVEGTDFTFKYSMMDPRDVPEVGISRKGYREHQFYATPSFQSEIPLSAFDWDRYEGLASPKNDFQKAGDKGICMIRLEPCSGEVRPTVWVNQVEENFKGTFDNYGPCKFGKIKLKETSLDLKKAEDRMSIMSEYMFTLIIGYSQTPDAITELIWDALTAGSIPVYFGAPNIREHVPPNSIIVGGDYSSKTDMVEYLNQIKTSKDDWEKMHAWRDDEKSLAGMNDKYGFLKGKSSSSYCRICRWTLATRYSLGWDHQKQQIRKTTLDSKLCLSKKSVLKGPFQEVWTTDIGLQKPIGPQDCSKTTSVQRMVFDEVSLDRTITMHDNGLIDMAIENLKSLEETRKVLLRLDFLDTIDNVDGAHILQPHQLMLNEKNVSPHVPLISSIAIQDRNSRVTILTNWLADLSCPKQHSNVDILVKNLKTSKGRQTFGEPDAETGFIRRLQEDEVLRIRVIIEDVNTLRDVASEYSVSPYARLMMQDFLDPLMFFLHK